MKKPRIDAFSEGSLIPIFKLLLRPLTPLKPPQMDLKTWWEHLFHVAERDITRYMVRRPFQMPGLHYQAPTVKIQGIGPRGVRAGSVVFVRTDSSNPTVVDVEWFRKRESMRSNVYQMTVAEFDRLVRPCIERARKGD